MAKKHSALTGADLHAPQGFSNEGATVVWHVTQSANTVNVSSSFVPTDNSSFDLGSSTASWNNIYLAGDIASSNAFVFLFSVVAIYVPKLNYFQKSECLK